VVYCIKLHTKVISLTVSFTNRTSQHYHSSVHLLQCFARKIGVNWHRKNKFSIFAEQQEFTEL